MAEVKLEKTPCDRELIEKILSILEKHEKLLPQFLSDKHKLYDNKTLIILILINLEKSNKQMGFDCDIKQSNCLI